jgi:hypothetical protein
MKLPDIEIIKVLNFQELNDKHNIEISNISNNITVSEIYESDISYSFRIYENGWTIKFYELKKWEGLLDDGSASGVAAPFGLMLI